MVAGVDEVGRGAFAGPLVAAAVVFKSAKSMPVGLNDSKQLAPSRRLEMARRIIATADAIGFGQASSDSIDENGITWATQRVFAEAVLELGASPDFILVDAYRVRDLIHIRQKAIVKGDQQVAVIAAASIMAKVYRDYLMTTMYHLCFPRYNFKQHKGYGTQLHRELIIKFGPCSIHRKSFLTNLLPSINLAKIKYGLEI